VLGCTNTVNGGKVLYGELSFFSRWACDSHGCAPGDFPGTRVAPASGGRRDRMIGLTKHAQEAVTVCGITFAWIEEAVSSPDFVEAESTTPGTDAILQSHRGFGGRVLRVVHRPAMIS